MRCTACISGRAAIESPRRVVAAALAGYIAINLCALLAAIELGIQPLLFRDASGAPLYAPYPLHIAIPAMMIGHLTMAGLAEMIVTAGVVAYLQRAEPSLLKSTAPGALASEPGRTQPVWRLAGHRPLWIALAVLMILTPLGILAAGSAWGEWSPADFSNPQARELIAAASGSQVPPARLPRDCTPVLFLDRAHAALRPALSQERHVRLPALGNGRNRHDHSALSAGRSGSRTGYAALSSAPSRASSPHRNTPPAPSRSRRPAVRLQRVDPRVKVAGLVRADRGGRGVAPLR